MLTYKNLARAHALIASLLPSSSSHLLPSVYPGRSTLLEVLSSGQILCSSYNTGVRRSRKPWGFINGDSIHDIAALVAEAAREDGSPEEAAAMAEKRRMGWTFRRTDNLRLWAAYVKFSS